MKSKEQRKIEAESRNEAYSKLTNPQKLAKLDAVFGKGLGAIRQREKLSI